MSVPDVLGACVKVERFKTAVRKAKWKYGNGATTATAVSRKSRLKASAKPYVKPYLTTASRIPCPFFLHPSSFHQTINKLREEINKKIQFKPKKKGTRGRIDKESSPVVTKHNIKS